MSTYDLWRKLAIQSARGGREPGERDKLIYLAVRVQGRSQREVAHSCGISQPRVCQIVRRVEAWRSPPAEAVGEGEFAAQAELAELQWLYEQAARNFRRSCEPKVVVKKNRTGETTTRIDQQGDTRLLWAMLRSQEKLQARRVNLLDQRQVSGGQQRIRGAIAVLIEARRRAAREGVVSTDEPAWRAVQRLVEELLGGNVEGTEVGQQPPRREGGIVKSAYRAGAAISPAATRASGSGLVASDAPTMTCDDSLEAST
ncbi:MAG: hypothetical protein SFU86_14630 [Pirellulaceae bacterium]|nr:hypothetical protein [Pirellulaceae bacterium]